MKVTIMTKEYPPYIYGGAGVHVEYLSLALASFIDVDVRCFGDQMESYENLNVKGYRSLQFPDGEFTKVLEPISVNVAMLKDPIDSPVVHCHTWYAMFAGFLAKTLTGTSLVTTVHSLEPLRPWKREQLGRGYDLTGWLEKLGLENSDRVIAVSQGVKADIMESYNIPEDKIRVIYNGVDLGTYKKVESKDTLKVYGIEEPYLLFVGRLSRQKGITVLLDALKYLPEEILLVLCATSPDTQEFEDEVRERTLGRKNIIWIRKMLSRKEIVELYSHAHIFVCPSIYEPFGIINLEAMACQTPVVASRVGGIKEVITHGETGLLVEPDDPKELALAIESLLVDEDARVGMGHSGRRRVEEKFSWKAIAKETNTLYEELLDSKN